MYVAHSREDGVFQSLADHLQGTAGLAAAFAAAFGAEAWGRILGLYHDVGKASAACQRRIRENGPRVDHSTAGAQQMAAHYHRLLAYCIAGHHGRLPDGGSPNADTPDSPTLAGRLKRTFAPGAAMDPAALPKERLPLSQFPFALDARNGIAMALFVRMLASCLIDADRLDTEAFAGHGRTDRGSHPPVETLYARLTAHLTAFADPKTPLDQKRNEIQQACIDRAADAPGLFSLTVPTGGGKTLSSLAFALRHAMLHGKKRILYVIPYQNIIEQTADVFRRAIGEDAVLEHHTGFAFDDDDQAHLRLRFAAENWDYPVIVTTSVRFFESLFSARTSQLRKIHRIADSVVILDEAQMLPLPYLLPCIDALAELTRHYRTTVVMMTATQPALSGFLPKDIPMREIMPDPSALYTFFRRVTIRDLGHMDLDALAGRLAGHPQALCIVNKRKTAQALFALLPEANRYHLSTLMHPVHRRRVLREIRERLDRGQDCRVIATSLVEAGVDLSMPTVYREQAGLDSIIQAAGRCNRNGEASAQSSFANVFRLTGKEGSVRMPSQQQAIFAADQVFGAFADPASREAIAAFFGGLYTLRGPDALDAKGIRALSSHDVRACNFPFRKIDDAFQFIESATVPVIIAIEPEAAALFKTAEQGDISRSLLRRLNAYTVNVYPDHRDALRAAGAIIPFGEDGWVMTCDAYYDKTMGVQLVVDEGKGLFA